MTIPSNTPGQTNPLLPRILVTIYLLQVVFLPFAFVLMITGVTLMMALPQ